MVNIKRNIIYLAVITSLLKFSHTYTTEVVVTKSGSEVVRELLGKAIDGLDIACPYVSVATQALSIGMQIKSHTFPNEEEMKRANAVAEKYSLLTTENEFQNCMRKNINSCDRGSSGRPTVCEDIARMLIILGAKNEVNNITSIYNELRK